MRDILQTFENHVADVQRLVAFDRDVMEVAISTVEDLHERLVKQKGIDNEQLNGARALHILRGIRDHGSLKPRFSLILNQAVVLLVSYFGSAVEDIFRRAVNARLATNAAPKLMKEEMKLTVSEVMDVAANPAEAVAGLLIEKKDLSFQDMQAIQRAFRDYVSIEIEKDRVVNNIILAQACRHVIVHAGGEMTPRLARQVSGAIPRDIKMPLPDEGVIQFSEEEVETVANSMKQYVSALASKCEPG